MNLYSAFSILEVKLKDFCSAIRFNILHKTPCSALKAVRGFLCMVLNGKSIKNTANGKY